MLLNSASKTGHPNITGSIDQSTVVDDGADDRTSEKHNGKPPCAQVGRLIGQATKKLRRRCLASNEGSVILVVGWVSFWHLSPSAAGVQLPLSI
jgi:hypothetical protein